MDAAHSELERGVVAVGDDALRALRVCTTQPHDAATFHALINETLGERVVAIADALVAALVSAVVNRAYIFRSRWSVLRTQSLAPNMFRATFDRTLPEASVATA